MGALIILLAVAAMVAVWVQQHRRHTRRIRNTPPPPTWLPVLESTLPMIRRMSGEHRRQLFGYMQIFLAEKNFEGCGGLELTEEIKVTVAAQACILLIGRESKVYPRLKTILIYPHAFQRGQKGLFGDDDDDDTCFGESWTSGVVVLAWDSVVGGKRNSEDGLNVTFHEFAHQLDQEDGEANGAPILAERSAYLTWASVFNHEYEALVDLTERGKTGTLDHYGATDPAEFFAVATETFFEKPHQLKDRHPELFEELKHYYTVDPTDWVEPT